ncbi:hypothetical protein G9C98_008485 [Cotesia typhae]|uniref:Alpha-1,6-mannosyl-glycoprotein 2-beta-N-acetylglucosaminyltransferase n=1 Tax=Cotesia typhae TaxID=2053667 RepID=A0A8J5R0F8_9HYME|nr:hypothetical protein G9C98_008485 [Cotesia typhae]
MRVKSTKINFNVGIPNDSLVERGLVKPYSVSSIYTRKKNGIIRGVTIAGGTRSGRGTLIRTLIFVFLATFLWLQLHVISLTGRNSSSQSSINESIYALVPQELQRFLKDRRNSSQTNGTLGIYGTSFDIGDIKTTIAKLNSEQKIYNDDIFGPLLTDAPIIVIQVHSRLTYLRHLIVSLAQAKGIEDVLLIFSHDVWNPDINYLIQSVDFCRCKIVSSRALALKCINAQHPDLYGHYREAKFTQTKHHWWWKANRVFDQLNVTRNHTGMVLFLEEDHYVAEDFLHVLKLMERTCKHSCERCNVLSLGTYLKTYNYYADLSRKYLSVNSGLQKEVLRGLDRHNDVVNVPDVTTQQHKGPGKKKSLQEGQQNKPSSSSSSSSWSFQLLPTLYSHYQKAEVIPWISSKHNMGMAFNRVTWNKLRKCASQFCSYDDYNWDWSLHGIHHKKNNCESTAVIAKVQQVLKSARNHLFPSQLTLTIAGVAKKTKLRKGNGGWGDLRDHHLCGNITANPDLVLL